MEFGQSGHAQTVRDSAHIQGNVGGINEVSTTLVKGNKNGRGRTRKIRAISHQGA